MKKVFRAGFEGKTCIVKNYILCESFFSKLRGLMFRSKDFKTALVFSWKKPGVYPIHSFFCRKFLAVWLIDGKILEKRAIFPWSSSEIPKKKFDMLIEIPLR